MLGEPPQLVNNPCVASCLGTDGVTSVVLEYRTNIPAFNGVGCPCFARGWLDVGHDLNSRWCNWVGVEIILAVDALPSRQLWGNECSSPEVESELHVQDGLVPKEHWERIVCGPPSCRQVFLGCTNGMFSCVTPVVVWGGQLVLDVVRSEKVFEFWRALVV